MPQVKCPRCEQRTNGKTYKFKNVRVCEPCAGQLSIAAALLGKLGGQVGGKSKSKAKQEAARENGKLGGRPKHLKFCPTKDSKGLSGSSKDRRKQRRNNAK